MSSKFTLTTYFSLVLFLAAFTSSYAQETIRCHTDERMELYFKQHPKHQKQIQQELDLKQKPIGPFAKSSITTIPVHVIIVHPPGQSIGSGSNLSVPHIESQITVLNEDFRRMNADASNTPSVFSAVDSEIEFCLATVDPNGNPTDGITRYATNQNLNSNEIAIKTATGWDNTQYLNIWVGPNLGGLLGWAYLPSTGSIPNSNVDGVVVATNSFGGPGFATGAPYDLGRTATHEVGHYLGLRHVWGNGGCGSDDGFADTPTQQGSNFGCPNHPSPSCNNGGDMFMNYMDYVDDDCMNAFTQDQANFMNLILSTSRAALAAAGNTNCNLAIPLVASVTNQTDVSCFGDADATITVQASGGSGALQYILDNGVPQSSPVFTNVSGGPHTVVVQDQAGNSIPLSVVIASPPPLIPLITSQLNISCFGENDGLVSVVASGGTPGQPTPYTYSIDGSPFSPGGLFSNLGPGAHLIEVKDGNGCVESQTVTLTSPAQLGLGLADLQGPACADDTDGLVQLMGLGGTPMYQYSIDQINYGPSPLFTGLTPGNYLFTVQDNMGCEAELDVSITAPNPLILEIVDSQDVLCAGDADGSITLGASGGTVNYAYSLDGQNFQPGATFDDLSAGTYTLFVQDQNGCQDVGSLEITAPAALELALTQQEDVACFGEASGSVEVMAGGGTGSGFVYSIQGSGSDQGNGLFENLSAGTYTLLVEDGNGCTDELSVTIEESAALELEFVVENEVDCLGGDVGAVSLAAAGGNGSFMYSFDNGPFTANPLFENLSAGMYEAVVMDGAGCSTLIEVVLGDAADIEAEVVDSTEPDCFGAANGSLSVAAGGGAGGFSYTLNGTTNSTGIFEDLGAGNYEVLIADANNCSTTLEAEITEPDVLGLGLESTEPPLCAGEASGTLEVLASGGSGSYSYMLDDETNTNGLFADLMPGTYTILVMDDNACAAEAEFTIEDTNPIEVVSLEVEDTPCGGTQAGTVQAAAAGGNGNFSFTLNGETNGTGFFEGLGAGTYDIMVEDDLGCIIIEPVTVNEGSDISLEAEVTQDIPCFGDSGSIQVSAAGGSGSYTFTLDNTTNDNGLFDGLTAGAYEVQVTDTDDCTSVVAISIEEPEAVSGEVVAQTPADCNGAATGSLEVSGLGGDGSYTFTLNGETNSTGLFTGLEAGNSQLTITDGQGCASDISVEITEPAPLDVVNTISVPADCATGLLGNLSLEGIGGNQGYTYTLGGETNTTGAFDQLAQGTYTVQIEDAEGCTTSAEITIEQVGGIEAEVLELGMIDCNGAANGSVQLDALGGLGVLTYTLGGQSNTTGQFTGLLPGEQTIEISDDNNCETSITITIEEPEALTMAVDEVTDIACFGAGAGAVSLSANGGTAAYLFLLNGDFNATGTFENLQVGPYTAQVIDANNCLQQVSFNIEEPAELLLDVQSEDITCFGEANGTITLEATGGTQDYTYLVNGIASPTGNLENLLAGSYDIVLTDANNCTAESTVTITEPTELSGDLTNTDVPCFGAADAEIVATATGGTAPYFYILNGGQTNTTGLFENLEAGDYVVTILDDHNCEFTLTTTIQEGDALDVDLLATTNIACAGESTGMLQVGASGGTGGYTYTLQGGGINTSGLFEDLTAGTYEIKATDAIGCQGFIYVSITEPDPFFGSVWSVTDDNGTGTGSVSVVGSGGTPPYQYAINNEPFQAQPIFEGLPAGDYALLIVDQMGCVVELTATVGLASSLEDLALFSHLQIFPNPFTADLWLSLELQSATDLDLTIYNVHGQRLAYEPQRLSAGAHQWRLPVAASWPAGTYFVEVRGERFVEVLRVVKE